MLSDSNLLKISKTKSNERESLADLLHATQELLSDSPKSSFFSANRHLQRSHGFTEPERDQSFGGPDDTSPITLQKLQFKTMVLENANDVAMEARHLLESWSKNSESQGLESEDIVKEIIDDLGMRTTYPSSHLASVLDSGLNHTWKERQSKANPVPQASPVSSLDSNNGSQLLI
jgi:hypothetical protein